MKKKKNIFTSLGNLQKDLEELTNSPDLNDIPDEDEAKTEEEVKKETLKNHVIEEFQNQKKTNTHGKFADSIFEKIVEQRKSEQLEKQKLDISTTSVDSQASYTETEGESDEEGEFESEYEGESEYETDDDPTPEKPKKRKTPVKTKPQVPSNKPIVIKSQFFSKATEEDIEELEDVDVNELKTLIIEKNREIRDLCKTINSLELANCSLKHKLKKKSEQFDEMVKLVEKSSKV